MKSTVVLTLATVILLTACNNNTSKESKNQQPFNSAVKADLPQNEIVKSSVTNETGQMLELEFDNARSTMKAKLNGDTIAMNREKTGSGIAASNEHYKYTE